MNLSIPPADVRGELLDNCEVSLDGPRDFLLHLLADAALPLACVASIEGALTLLAAAGAQLEAAATIADNL